MSCKNCKKDFRKDGTEPDCWDGECKIPPLDEQGMRILEIRNRILELKDLVDAGAILNIYRATEEDLELLAAWEQEIQKSESKCNPAKKAKCQAEFGEYLDWACKNCEEKTG